MSRGVNIPVVGFPKVGLPIVGWESRGETSQKPDGSISDGSKAETLDIVFANKNTRKLKIVKNGEWSIDEYPKEEWEPVGIVVIPGEHGVLKDDTGKNQCGVMSIVPMNCNTPKTGGSLEESMYWGVNLTDIAGLTNYNKVVVTSNDSSIIATGLSSSFAAYIPIQSSVGGVPTRSKSPYSLSPYIGSDYKSGGYNESYGTTEFDDSSNFNALADFDGIGNTQKIIQQRGTKDYNSWKPNYASQNDYPAASCCDMFSTIGTKQGDWYLPASGELGYILPRLYDINDTISKLNSAYGIGVRLGISNYYWSSSEYSNSHARTISTDTGSANNYGKGSYSPYVRAFLRLGGTLNPPVPPESDKPALVLESGGYILLEDGGKILL